MADRFVSRRYSLKNKFGDRISDKTDQSFASAFDFEQIIDLFATENSRYFAQIHWIIVILPRLGYGVQK